MLVTRVNEVIDSQIRIEKPEDIGANVEQFYAALDNAQFGRGDGSREDAPRERLQVAFKQTWGVDLREGCSSAGSDTDKQFAVSKFIQAMVPTISEAMHADLTACAEGQVDARLEVWRQELQKAVQKGGGLYLDFPSLFSQLQTKVLVAAYTKPKNVLGTSDVGGAVEKVLSD